MRLHFLRLAVLTATVLAGAGLAGATPAFAGGGSVAAQGCSASVSTWRTPAESGLTNFAVSATVNCGFNREAALRLGVDCDTGNSPRFTFRDGYGSTRTSGTTGSPMIPSSRCDGRVLIGYYDYAKGDFVWSRPSYFAI
ncbi:hypothetical protein ACFWNN_09740 [Lentzea sp. NPDC058450]|uniref:hypothetical protein n=1 Tax=Lentzea sp. NPDC058450 TaxID=3346505 RepID=UPI00365E032F